MDALEPFPLFKSVIGLEVPSGERCHNDTALLHNNNTCKANPACIALPHSLHADVLGWQRILRALRCVGKAMYHGRTPVAALTQVFNAMRSCCVYMYLIV